MSENRQEMLRRQREGELVLQAPMAFIRRESNLLEVLESRRQPRRRQDVKSRLVNQWKQTLALSSAAARKLVTDPPPTPKPKPRRAPPTPPKPQRESGRTTVNRIRRETEVEAAPKPAVEAAPAPVAMSAPEPVVQTALPGTKPTPSRWIPILPSLSQRLAEVAVQTAATVLFALAVKAGGALAAIADRAPFPLT